MARQAPHVRAHPASWLIWAASLLLAVMPLCFAVSGRLKTVPMVLLFVTGLVLLVTCA